MCWIRPPLRLFPQLPSFIPSDFLRPAHKPLFTAEPAWLLAVASGWVSLITTQYATLRNIHPHRRRQTPDHRCPPTLDQPYLRDGPRADLPRTIHRYLVLRMEASRFARGDRIREGHEGVRDSG